MTSNSSRPLSISRKPVDSSYGFHRPFPPSKTETPAAKAPLPYALPPHHAHELQSSPPLPSQIQPPLANSLQHVAPGSTVPDDSLDRPVVHPAAHRQPLSPSLNTSLTTGAYHDLTLPSDMTTVALVDDKRDSTSSSQYESPSQYSTPPPPPPQIAAPIPPIPVIIKPADLTQAGLPASPPSTESGSSGGTGNSSINEEPKILAKPAKLRKELLTSRRRSASLQQPGFYDTARNSMMRSNGPMLAEPRGRTISEQPLQKGEAMITMPPPRIASQPIKPSQSPTRAKVRKSWLPGGRSRSNSVEVNTKKTAGAWTLPPDESQAEYNTSLLQSGGKIPELWNEAGTILVHLYPESTGCPASFKVPAFTVSSSIVFGELIQFHGEDAAKSRPRNFEERSSLSIEDATRLRSPPASPPILEGFGESHLYLPVAPPSSSGHLLSPDSNSEAELERIVALRNLFAFLNGRPLVGTRCQPTNFHVFVRISELLQEFAFTNANGTSFGDAVDMSFGFYMEQLDLADCRHSREKTVEALILGEKMKSAELYSQAFAHAAGKWSSIIDLRLPIFNEVPAQTRQSLEKAHFDLLGRQKTVNNHLEQFTFPSIFAGIASSTSMTELKTVGFKTWRTSYNKMRSFVQNYYKVQFGSWPPKASSKKNPFTESGLNRLVLKMLYSDLCALYDLLVDRTSITDRIKDAVPNFENAPTDKMSIAALRGLLAEYDRSTLPVKPPIPFDVPQLPSMTSVLASYDRLSTKNQVKFDKKVKEHELLLIVNKAYNYDAGSMKIPFLEEFKNFELSEARGKLEQEIADQRFGYWVFLYVVIQSLPLLVVDAPGLKFTEGVEYFLCQPPMGNLPWVEDRQAPKMWYTVPGEERYVELSTDTVNFSVEATYDRSHCWVAAGRWQSAQQAQVPQEEVSFDQPPMSPLHPPRPQFQDLAPPLKSPAGTPTATGPSTPSPPPGGPVAALRPRNLSPAGRPPSAWRASMAMGLEPVPMAPPPSLFGMSNGNHSTGSLTLHDGLSMRSLSTGNLAAMNVRDSRVNLHHPSPPLPPPQPSATSQQTFDDILAGGKKEGSEKKTTSKKKGFFF